MNRIYLGTLFSEDVVAVTNLRVATRAPELAAAQVPSPAAEHFVEKWAPAPGDAALVQLAAVIDAGIASVEIPAVIVVHRDPQFADVNTPAGSVVVAVEDILDILREFDAVVRLSIESGGVKLSSRIVDASSVSATADVMIPSALANDLAALDQQLLEQLIRAGGGVYVDQTIAPAVFIGTQECSGIVPDFDLWNLTADIPGHPADSTVSAETLLAAGYRLPPKAMNKASS